MDLARFKRKPVMGILRGITREEVGPLFATIEQSGLETVEITMNTDGACGLIEQAVKLSGDKLMIGAGTVLDLDQLKAALDAGAGFVVSPVLVLPVVEYCVQKNIPVFPGAFDPQGIFEAWRAGAAMVKVFPARFLGPDYFKEIKGPLEQVELLACSGVTPENLADFFSSGASAVAIGSGVFKPEWIRAGEYQKIENRIRDYLLAVDLQLGIKK